MNSRKLEGFAPVVHSERDRVKETRTRPVTQDTTDISEKPWTRYQLLVSGVQQRRNSTYSIRYSPDKKYSYIQKRGQIHTCIYITVIEVCTRSRW